MRALLLAATALALLSGSAYAQTSNSGSNSTTTVNTSSGSQSSSVSNPRVNVIGNPIGNGASSSTSGAKSTSSSRSNSRSAAVGNVTNVYSGYTGGTTDPSGSSTTGTAGTGAGGDPTVNMNYSGSYTVRNTPEVIPPNVMGGNPCAVGASGGLSMPGFGLAMGATWADRSCERRQQAALLFNMGEQKVALELMCQDDNIRSAMRVAARPCTADTPAPVSQAPAATAPVAQAAAPALIAVTASAPAKPMVIASAMPAAPKPEWCARAKPDTEASKAYVAQVCGR